MTILILENHRLLDDESDDMAAEPLDEHSTLLEEMLTQETAGRGRPKALCYEDIMLMVVRHPETGKDVLAMVIKFIHHKSSDNKPKPAIFFFTTTRRLIFCPILVIISLALADGAFDASNLTGLIQIIRKHGRVNSARPPTPFAGATTSVTTSSGTSKP
ncbi:hypothetical protein F5883DRAFT_566585 [Diaporthe sp. PMI_573]|nr:hypothetical protein F5883DRAFT_566585 [Diaporthaceae sp. PMI_573]